MSKGAQSTWVVGVSISKFRRSSGIDLREFKRLVQVKFVG